MTLLEHALQYAKDGFAVFPLKGKHPIGELVPHGFKNATTDAEIIKKWWSRYPKANIGIATGTMSNGVFVIDVDVQEAKNKDGIATLNAWEIIHGTIPDETWTCLTGRGEGGYHLYFHSDSIVRSKNDLYPAIDIKGEGGYVVAPPSIHPDTGLEYTWELMHHPDEHVLMDANDLVYKFLSPIKETVNEPFQADEVIEEGKRNETIFKYVCSLQAKGYDDDSVFNSALLMNKARCVPPLTNKELKTIMKSALRYEKGSVSGSQNENNGGFASFAGFAIAKESENPVFNNEWLSCNLGIYADELAESLQVPPDLSGIFVLGMFSVGAQRNFNIKPKIEWTEALNLYIAVIADPSERKTPVVSECAKPIYQFEKEENERRAPAIADYLTRKEIYTNQMNFVKKAASSKKGEVDTENNINHANELKLAIDDLKEVFPYTAIADDITQEALARLMYENDGVLSIVSSEGGIFNMMNGKYKSTSDYDIYLKAYSAKEPIKIHRVGRAPVEIEHPTLSIILAVQPIVINNVMNNEEMNGKGLNSRFLYAKPKSRVGSRKYEVKEMNDFSKNNYMNALARLMAMPTSETPRIIELSEGAKQMANAYFDEIEGILKEMPATPLKAWIGKLHGQTMKIAGVLHVMEHIEKSDLILVSEKTMKNAIEMGRYFLAHARYTYKASGMSDRPEEKDAKYILKRIEESAKPAKPAKLSKKEVFDLCKDKTGFEKVEYLNDGLNELVRRGYIRIVKQQNPNGGRPTEIIEFSPDYLATLDKKDHARA